MNSDKTEQEFSTDPSESLDDLLTLIKENSPSLGVFHIHIDSSRGGIDKSGFITYTIIQIFHKIFTETNNFGEDRPSSSPQFEFQYSPDITSTLLKAIADNSSIITFDFSYVNGNYEFSDLLFMLRENSSIKRICCRDIMDDLKQTIHLFKQLASKLYDSIWLFDFNFNSDNLEIFFQTLLDNNPSLQSLRLGGLQITSECVSLLQTFLPLFTGLRDLGLSPGLLSCEVNDQVIASSLEENYVLTSFTCPRPMPLCDGLIARNKEAQEQKLFKTVKQASH